MKPSGRAAPLLLGALFAVAYPLGMPGYDVPWLPFAALVPFLRLAVRAPSPRGAAVRTFVAGLAANIPLYYWIAYAIAVPGRIGWTAGSAATLLVSAYLALYMAAAGWAAFRLHDRFGEAGLLAFPAVWTALELARSVLFTGFPWMLLGYGLSGSLPLRQAADLAGVFGLGFLVALANVLLDRGAARIAGGSFRAAMPGLVLFAAVPGALLGYGSFRAGDPPGTAADVLRVGVAQGGIDQSLKWDPSYQEQTIAIYRTLTREVAKEGVDVVIWPETAAPFFYGWEDGMSRQVDDIAARAGVPLVFGAPWFEPSDGGKYYNSVFLLDGRGTPSGRYDKQHLVPFGEYVPLKGLLSFVRKLTAGAEDFSPGSGPSLFPVAGSRAGASVCYEAVFPGIIRKSVLDGATWLVNVTNDSWFGDTVAPRQHLAMARMRSVEFRRPMVRAANAGISAVIDARGEVTADLALFRRGTLQASVRPGRGMTPYARSGEAFAISCTIIAFLILLTTRRGTHGLRNARRKNRSARIANAGPSRVPLR